MFWSICHRPYFLLPMHITSLSCLIEEYYQASWKLSSKKAVLLMSIGILAEFVFLTIGDLNLTGINLFQLKYLLF